VYLRFGKAPLYDLPAESPFVFGRARQLRPGNDGAFIATGETVIHALLAAARLERTAGLACRVLSVPTVKPLDTDAVLAAAAECPAIVTVEEHMVHGGLGEACAAVLAQAVRLRPFPRFAITGIPDEYTVTGNQGDIFRHYGLTMEALATTMNELVSD
jgi:transketolase